MQWMRLSYHEANVCIIKTILIKIQTKTIIRIIKVRKRETLGLWSGFNYYFTKSLFALLKRFSSIKRTTNISGTEHRLGVMSPYPTVEKVVSTWKWVRRGWRGVRRGEDGGSGGSGWPVGTQTLERLGERVSEWWWVSERVSEGEWGGEKGLRYIFWWAL